MNAWRSSGAGVINGAPLVEPYVRNRRPWDVPELTLTASEYYVIGDNRGMRASDHDFGRVDAGSHSREDRVLSTP